MFRLKALVVLVLAVALTFIVVLAGSLHNNAASETTSTTAGPTTVASSTSSVSSTSTTVTPTTVLAARRHYTVLEIGDSLGTDLGGGLGHQLATSPRVTLVQKGKSETGLANAWFYDWPQHLKTYLAQYHPQLLIVLLGGNDEQSMDVDHHAAAFDTPTWRTQYAKNVRVMMREATKANCSVLWVGMPIMYPNYYREGMKVINSIFANVASATPRVTFLSTWKYMANRQGQFQFSAWVNGSYEALRSADGIHPTAVGQNVLATYVVQQMHTIYRLPVTPAFPMFFSR